VTSWYPAPCLLTLREELDERYPDRDRASDGMIGDPSHASRDSQHNPDWASIPPGCVRAYDVDSNGPLGVTTPLVRDVLEATIGDPRVWYVIWAGKIASRSHGWVWRVYTGASMHLEHVHLSLRAPEDGISEAYAHELAYDTTMWFGDKPTPHTFPAVRLHRVVEAARHPRREVAPANVRRVQRCLVARGLLTEGRVTGIYGASTRDAVHRFQRSIGFRGPDADGILGVTSGTRLLAGRYRLLP
jgi:hypothetical protein